MNMTAEQLAQLREVAERAKEYGGIARYTKAMVARLDFSEAFTPAVVLALLDELERKDALIVGLGGHLKSAHAFIENTEAFGHEAASGILKCGGSEWDVDSSKESLAAAGINLTVEG